MRLKRKKTKIVGSLVFLTATFLLSAGGLQAQTTYNLFVHGLSSSDHCAQINNTTDGRTDLRGYWSGINFGGMPNVRFVGFAPNATNGAFSWDSCGAQAQLARALNTFCRRFNNHRCRIFTHSTGGLVLARHLEYLQSAQLAHFYDIRYMRLMANASGGAELASAAGTIQHIPLLGWLTGRNAVRDSVRIGPARDTFNHNRTAGLTLWLTSGEGRASYWAVTRPFLRGTNDSVLSNHTMCGVNEVASFQRCPVGSGQVRHTNLFWRLSSRWDNYATDADQTMFVGNDHSAARGQFVGAPSP